MRQCLSGVETQKRRPGWHGGLCVTARADGQEKSMLKSQGKGEQAVRKSLHHFFACLQELEPKLPECVTNSSEIKVGYLM